MRRPGTATRNGSRGFSSATPDASNLIRFSGQCSARAASVTAVIIAVGPHT